MGARGEHPHLRHLSRSGPRLARIWMDFDCFEPLLESNRRMHEALGQHGYATVYRTDPAGQNDTAWPDDGWRGLKYQFGSS